MNEGNFNGFNTISSEFISLLKCLVVPSREHLRGTQNYLNQSERDNYSKELIREIESRRQKITRGDLMYLAYHRQPYMRSFSREEYAQRWGDIQTNMLRINQRGLTSLPDMRKEPIWGQCWSDLLAEQQYRGGVPKDLPQSEAVASFLSNLQNRIEVDDEVYMWERAILKFGKREHIEASYNDESLRFMPASYYSSPELNNAQKDSESSFSFVLMPELFDDMNGLSGLLPFDIDKNNSRVTVRFDAPEDYYMWCAADRFDPRTPYAFGYDTMLAVFDKKRFIKSLKDSLLQLGGTNFVARSVDYFDPHTELSMDVDVAFAKHFRFSYQREYRAVANFQRPTSPLTVPVPGLRKYAEVIQLR